MSYGVIVSIISVTLAIIAYIVKISIDYSKSKSEIKFLQTKTNRMEEEIQEVENDAEKIGEIHSSVTNIETRLNHVSDRMEEDRAKNSEKFTELYSYRNETIKTLAELTSTLKAMSEMMNQKLETIEKSLEKQNTQFENQIKNLERKIDELKYRRQTE